MDLSGYLLEPLREDGEFVLYRARAKDLELPSVLLLSPVSNQPSVETLKKIDHEHSLKDELDATWAVRPLAISVWGEKKVLVLEDLGGESLGQLIRGPMEIKPFLRLAIGLADAIGQLHKRHLIHQDVKPSNVLVSSERDRVWLTGFGIASRLPRERRSPEAPEFIGGTLAYMAPEQTGRMNRSIDSRSDLYSLGVTLYEMLTGSLPFIASDPLEWVHSQIARQPVPPHERLQTVPLPVSAIVMKLLAKTPEDRYQTAHGVERDLERCLTEWERNGSINQFQLGQQDVPDRLLIPEKLYGRAPEIRTLLSAFGRVVDGGRPELILVSGYSGIGKSSVVSELQKELVPPRGLFASGKFDQYKRDIPYATLAQAFQSLVRPLLTKSEGELSKWREALRDALGPNGQLIVDLVPELKLIIGEQPPVPELPLQDAQRRFQLVFRRFVGVFARPEHPLALFLDDLQWLDAATLDLIEDLLTQSDVEHLMLIGAYRDNEVDSSHPLTRKLERIRKSGATVQEIILAPLALEDLAQLITDSLRCEPERAAPLAELVHEKTAGNPFFAIQFIYALADAGLLTFDYGLGQWSWDVNSIRAKGYTDNVVDLLVSKLSRLPVETQKALQLLACMGNSADFALLEMVSQDSNEGVHAPLWEAVREGLIFRSEASYGFLHDRVQEAAYSLIPEDSRAKTHLRIGKLLVAHTSPQKVEEGIFEIVNQLNRATALITSGDEREQLAELNLIAGKRSKVSTAYASALKYLVAGSAALGDDRWERLHELSFQLELYRSECEFLTGQLAVAEQRLSALSSLAADTVERATVASLQMDLYTTLDQSARAVAVGLDHLRQLGIQWSAHPTDEEVGREYDRIWSQVGSRAIEELIDLPPMSDLASLATLDVLTKLFIPALFTDANLLSLATCAAVNLSIELGNTDASCVAYVWLGQIAGPHFGSYEAGFRFGQLGYELVERRGLQRFKARTYMVLGHHVVPWTKHVRAGRDLLRRAFETANNIGDLTFAAYSCINLNSNLLIAGDPLEEVQQEAMSGLQYAQKIRFGFAVDHMTSQLGLIRTLRGVTPKFGSFNDDQFDELRFEGHLASDPALAQAECFYWIRKLQARFLAGDHASALDAASRAQRLLWSAPSNLEYADYEFYSALAHAASWHSAPSDRRQQHFDAVLAHSRQLEIWAKHCPENFENRASLVDAETARIEGRDLDAMRLYEGAIRSAHANGFVHNDALANELAARFYTARGFEKIAISYLRDARYGYLRWGAAGKVRQLDELNPQLHEDKRPTGIASTIAEPVEHLDLTSVIKVSQAVTGEMDLDKLIDTIMRTAIEHAGAERGLLILPRGTDQRIEAEATINRDAVVVRRGEAALSPLPESILHFVVRTQECVILDDAAARNPFSTDTYFGEHHARSVLCLPLINQGKLIGVLYLENNLTPCVFIPARVAVLKVLASQAAISLENTRLYHELKRSEESHRIVVETASDVVISMDESGLILLANPAAKRVFGYDSAELIGKPLTILMPEFMRKLHETGLRRYLATGQRHLNWQGTELIGLRKNGEEFPLEVSFGEQIRNGHRVFTGFIRDISEKKKAEEALRRSESYLAQAQKLSRTGSFGWDVSSGEIYWSRETFRIFEYEPTAQVSLDQIVERTHPEDRLAVQQLIERVSRERKEWDFEHRLQMPNGSVKYLRVMGHPSRGQTGRFEFVGAVADITEQRRAEEALRASELSLRLMVDSIPGLVNTTTAAGDIELANQQLLDYVGMTLEELKNWRPLVHPDDRALVETLWSNSIERGHPYEDEHRLRRADGVYRWFHARGLPLREREGRIVRWYVLLTDIDERKKAEEQLRRSEAYLSEAQRLTHTGSWVWQVAGRDSLYLSEEWYRIFGFEIAEGMPGWEKRLQRVHPADRSKWQEVIERAIREESEYDIEYRILLPDGTLKWIHVVAHPVFNASGDLVQFMGTSMDITGRKLAEETLRRSESYLAQAQRLAHIGSWAWEIPSRDALYISDEWFRTYGFDPKDGMPSWEQRLQRIHPEDRARFQAAVDRAIAEKSDYDVEFRILRPHSPGRYIHSVGHPVFGPSGELLQYVGVSMDITERKQAEEAFRLIVVATAATTGSDFFHSLVQHLAQALRARYAFVTACDDQKHARTLAVWKGDSFGENFEFDIADTPCEKVLHAELCHYRQGLQGLFPLDKILADWQAESYLGIPMVDGSNRVIGHIAILDDRPMEADLSAIDLLKIFASRAAAELKRQRAEDELQASLQERERLRRAQAELAHINRVSTMGELTASLAHEIKQPIGATVTNAEACLRLLDRDQPDLPEAREAALEMVKDARRAADIIDRVRSLYQKGSSQLDPVDINGVIGEMVAMLQNEAKRHSVMIRTDLAGALPPVMADRVQLQQVLMNLMLNGIEAIRDAGGELSIKSRLAEDGQLLISVTDTGMGLPTENPDQIFNPFFTTKSQGTGLGLAITRSIVESHGGRIWANANSGRGATFHFTLPSRVAVAA